MGRHRAGGTWALNRRTDPPRVSLGLRGLVQQPDPPNTMQSLGSRGPHTVVQRRLQDGLSGPLPGVTCSEEGPGQTSGLSPLRSGRGRAGHGVLSTPEGVGLVPAA